MEDLIKQARSTIPFDLVLSRECEGRCDECPFKLLEVLDTELCNWESRLRQGDNPNLDDVHSLARDCKEIYAYKNRDFLVKGGYHNLLTILF